MCCNINLVKPFGNYALLNTGSTAKNLRSRHDQNLSVWNQYYRPSCMSNSIESLSYFSAYEHANVGLDRCNYTTKHVKQNVTLTSKVQGHNANAIKS